MLWDDVDTTLRRECEAVMPFSIVVLKGSQELNSTPRGESLKEAGAYAISHFPVQRLRHGATEVQVRNEFGDILFRHTAD